jgi:23S rRNA (adenine1618-N6)-methyltransferase
MTGPKKQHPKEKVQLHPRNRHRERYDFKSLTTTFPPLQPFVRVNEYGDESVDFFDPTAVLNLNKALLKHFYHIGSWDIPKNYLCPPIPGRADYIHYAADLLALENNGVVPWGPEVNCLDVGVGANCIYPIIGTSEYGWLFVGSDIDPVSIDSAKKIVESNLSLKDRIVLRIQPDRKQIFRGIFKASEYFDLTVCNPPFHASAAEAQSGALRKLSNLKGKKMTKPVLNFGGKNNELWCEGGEERFVADMIRESKSFGQSCLWFTTLISKESNLKGALRVIESAGAADVRIIPMSQGNKASRMVGWTFLTSELRNDWVNRRWTTAREADVS